MDDGFHQRVFEVFTAAQQVPPAEREGFVAQACGADAGMREEVLSLLAADDQPLDLLDDPGDGGLLRHLAEPADLGGMIGWRLDEYEVTGVVAAGGMGTVLRATQDRPRRTVAIKVMHRSLDSVSARRRFDFEAELLARLHHPGIAEVYGVGVHEEAGRGVPYIVMEYVRDACALTVFADARGLDLAGRIGLFLQVCRAVEHGHQHGVVHRDLKPENLLVAGDGQVKVIDFGVARAIGEEFDDRTTNTVPGQIVGTLAYMSPEQVRGSSGELDTRTDVYALGVVLYRLLAGRLPIDTTDVPLPEVSRRICETDPERLGALDPELAGDVETIVSRALEKEKERRYQSAGELAADLERYLRNEPILARPATTFYQLLKFAQRNRGLVAGLCFGAGALVLGAVIALQQAFGATRARDDARVAAYRANIAAASAALDAHDVALARRSLQETLPGLRHWEWRHLGSRLDASLYSVPLEFDADAARPALTSPPGGLRLHVLTPQGIADLDPGGDGRALRPAFAFARSGRGRFEVRATTADAGGWALVLRDTAHETERVVATRADAQPTQVAVREDGAAVAWIAGATVHTLDLASGATRALDLDLGPAGMRRFELSPDGWLAFAGARSGRPAVWHPGARELRPLPGIEDLQVPGRSVAFAPDGGRLAVGFQDTTIRVWRRVDRVLGPDPVVLRGHRHAVTDVAFSPDGRVVASASLDRTIRLWDAETGHPFAVLQGHTRGIERLAFSDDGAYLASYGADDTVRVWRTAGSEPGELIHDGMVFAVEFSADGALLATAGWDDTVRIFDAATYDLLVELKVDIPVVTALAFARDAGVLVASGGGRFRAWDLRRGARLPEPTGLRPADARPVHRLAFAPDGELVPLPWSFGEAEPRAWNPRTGAVVPFAAGRLRELGPKFCSPDGRFLATYCQPAAGGVTADTRSAAQDSGIDIAIRRADGRPSARLPALNGAFAFRPTPGSADCAARLRDARETIALLDLATGKTRARLVGHTDEVYSIQYLPDGSRIASASKDSLRLWDADTGEEIVQLTGHRSFVWALAFAPDGSQLASASGDRRARIWDTLPFRERDAFRRRRVAALAVLRPRIRSALAAGTLAPVLAQLRGDGPAHPGDAEVALLLEAFRK